MLFGAIIWTSCAYILWKTNLLTAKTKKTYHHFVFFQHFYHVLTCLRRPQGRGLELARKHIACCISELESALASSEFLRSITFGACEDGIDDKTTASGCQPIGFDASLNCRLSAPTPPRAIKILSWKKVRVIELVMFK